MSVADSGVSPANGAPMNIEIRKATLDDAPAICEIGNKVFRKSFEDTMSAKNMDLYLSQSYTLDVIRTVVGDTKSNLFLVAARDGVVLGFAQLKRGTLEPSLPPHLRSWIELNRLYVALDAAGSGIGTLLMREAHRVARHEEQAEGMWLGVFEFNYGAQRFYERLGYVRCGEHDFVSGEHVDTDWIVWKRLED